MKKSQVIIKKIKVKKKNAMIKKQFYNISLNQITAEQATKNMLIAETMT